MLRAVEALLEEAERQVGEGAWVPSPEDRAVAGKAAVDLAAVGADDQPAGSEVDRLERLREALAVLAVALASVHGHLAWFIGAVVSAVSPVLNWRAMPDDGGPTFHAVTPTSQQYAEAEEAVRRIQDILTRVIAAEHPAGEGHERSQGT
ncbi:hypothetical protein ACFU8I_08710 [Streptomyces sp. NPDC057540]|uniref:hypothetical protein n=1 Tax=Streptomyces sp. NPDC057540 TaxID=3346160 RepID=UPI0036C83B83